MPILSEYTFGKRDNKNERIAYQGYSYTDALEQASFNDKNFIKRFKLIDIKIVSTQKLVDQSIFQTQKQ